MSQMKYDSEVQIHNKPKEHSGPAIGEANKQGQGEKVHRIQDKADAHVRVRHR